jgi:Sulfotransferase family
MATLPDFLVIGAAKSGTISLYHYLAQHPDVFMCPVNESNFFALEKADWATEYLGPVDRFYVDQHCVKTIENYRNLFSEAKVGQRTGESSPLYLFSSTAPFQIKHHVPAAKIIAILRRPVDRAFSNYQDLRRSGIEPIGDFREAIRAEPLRHSQGWGPWPFWYYAEMGFFARQLQIYIDIFGSDHVFVGLYEDLRDDAAGLMKRIYRFIGVDENYKLDVSTRHNLGGVPRHDWIQRWILDPNTAKSLLKKVVPDGLRRDIRERISGWNTVRPSLDSDLRRELNEMYREDTLALQTLIARDLSHWL